MICSLLLLLERRDESLSEHANAVSDLATALAQKMELEPKEVARIGMAALLHDIGKVAIPEMPAVRHHHERWDGSGYPDHLSDKDIPLAARIIAVAEAYDFMGREHRYQARRSPEESAAELQRGMGTQFDPLVVQAFFEVLDERKEGALFVPGNQVHGVR